MSETKGDYYPRINALLQEEEIQRLQAKVNMLEAENAELKEKLAQYEEGFPVETAPRDGTLFACGRGVYDNGVYTNWYEDKWNRFCVEDFTRWWPLPGGAK